MAAPVRARDLQSNVREHGFEKGMFITLGSLLDEYAEHRQHMRQLTELVSTCVDKLDQFIKIGEGMSQRLEQMKRDRQQGEHNAEDQP